MVSSRLWHHRPKHIYSKDEGGVLAGLFKTEKVYAITGTFYPDPDPEVSSFDGSFETTGADWSTVIGKISADTMDDGGSTGWIIYEDYTTVWNVARSIFLFDTSSIGASNTISDATISIYATYKGVVDGDNVSVVSSNPVSNTGSVLGDYSSLGNTSYSNVALNSISISAYNAFVLDSNGKANISLIGVSKFGFKTGKDVTATAPAVTAAEYLQASMAEQTGTSQDPKLVVTYTLPVNPKQDVIWFD